MSLPFWPKPGKLFQTSKLPAGDGDSSVHSINLCIPPSLALHRLGLSVMLTSSRISRFSLTTARFIVPDAYYRPITQAAVPVSYYSWKSRFFVTVTRIKQSDQDLFQVAQQRPALLAAIPLLYVRQIFYLIANVGFSSSTLKLTFAFKALKTFKIVSKRASVKEFSIFEI